MKNTRFSIRLLVVLYVFFFCVLLAETGSVAMAAKSEKQDTYAMTEAQLQSQLMNFADSFTSMLASAFARYDTQSPSAEERFIILSLVQYTASSAVTIAAGSNPDDDLLDMVALVSLGRMVYEEDGLRIYGSRVEPIVESFQKAEKDIWNIVDKILTQNQQQELKSIITDWREANPEVFFFPYIRFGDFYSGNQSSAESRAKGLFSSIKNATQEVEAMRLMAERAVYLGSRLPLMTGGFLDIWVSRLNQNPEVKRMMDDVHQFVLVSEQFASLTENISQEREKTIEQVVVNMTNLMRVSLEDISKKVSKEREATINQFMNRMSEERKDTIEDFISEEQRIHGLLTDLKQTLSVSNELATSTLTLVDRLDIGKTESGDASPLKEPFDIKDYQVTLVKASDVIQQLDRLLVTFDRIMLSEGWEQALPRIVEAIDRVGSEGDERIDRIFLLGLIFILIFLVGQFFLFVAYRYINLRYIEPKIKDRSVFNTETKT